MSIISTTMLSARLPGTADASTLQLAVTRATSFINTWAIKYDPFDDYQESPEEILAPDEIGEMCLLAAEAYYYKQIGLRSRNSDEMQYWNAILYGGEGVTGLKTQLKDIKIEPTWETQTISLNTYNCMLIGSRTATGAMWPRVIPFTAQVISGGSSVWVQPDDWYIRTGGQYNDEYWDAWYLDVTSGSSVEGTLRYMRTYRNDGLDYARYNSSGYDYSRLRNRL